MARNPPPENGKWKPGKSGNPSGKPKGTLSAKTILKKYLAAEITGKNAITGQKETLTTSEHIMLALVRQALDGSVPAANTILDRTEGKAKQNMELTGNAGGPIKAETTIFEIQIGKGSKNKDR